VWQLVLYPPRREPNPTPELWDWPLLFTAASQFHSTWITFPGFHTLLLHFTIPSLPFVQVCSSTLFLSSIKPQRITHIIRGFLSVAVYHHRPPHPVPLLCSRRIGQDNYAPGDDPIIQTNKISLLSLLPLIPTLLENLGCVLISIWFKLSNCY